MHQNHKAIIHACPQKDQLIIPVHIKDILAITATQY